MVSDRRKFMRFDVSLDVAFRASKNAGDYVSGVTKNFSRSGLCFESPAVDLALMSPIELEIKLPYNDTLIPVAGNVAWKEQLEDNCLIGLEFTEINKEAKSQILDYAYDRWVERNRNLKSAAQG
ncbi:MAG: PilZ domain-containing protein [Nitrospirae bacterium]|nr:PilZ domain-containing protein [Nitrospirota bacterium]